MSTTTLLDQVIKLANIGYKTGQSYQNVSLSQVSTLTEVRPLTIIDNDCTKVDYLPDVLQCLLSMFTAYYLRAVNYTAVVSDVKVAKVLDRLNPDRSNDVMLLGGSTILGGVSSESINNSIKYSLPGTISSFVTESLDHWSDKESKVSVAGKDNLETIIDSSSLAVGKLINVKIQVGDKEKKTIEIPVNVNLSVSITPVQTIKRILTIKSDSNSLDERWWKYKTGQISFIKDLILCQDLIDEHKKALMNDTEGTYSEMIRRVNNAKKYGLITANPSLVSASNLFVLSKDTIKEIEDKLNGKISNDRIRQAIFNNTYAMIIAIIDRDHDTITFYINGVNHPTDVTSKSLKASNKGKGPDILDMLKAFNMSSSSSL